MNDNSETPLFRGEVWLAELDPDRKSDFARARLVLLVSDSRFNLGDSDMVIVLPITTRNLGIPAHVPLRCPEAGVPADAVILCDRITTLKKDRLMRRLGLIDRETVQEVDDKLAIMLGLFAPA